MLDHSLNIETTQNVSINFEVASAAERGLAWFIDILIICLYTLIVVELFKFIDLVDSWVMAIPLTLTLFYHIFFELILNGQTPGKKICKIKVMKLDGRQPSMGGYIIRWIFRIFEFTLFPGLALIAFFWNDKGQRIADALAGTTVIKIQKQLLLSDTVIVNIPENYTPVFPQVQSLSNRDIEVIKDALKFFHTNKNYEVLHLAAMKVANHLSISTNMTQLEFLNTIIQDFNYYQQG